MNSLSANRRTFLKAIIACGLLWHSRPTPAAAESRLLSRQIPASGEALPAIGLGTSHEFGTAGDNMTQLSGVLRTFINAGGTLIDTAPGYGRAEQVLGELIADLDIAQNTFIATKVRTTGRQAGEDQFVRSENRLGKSPLDLVQVHSLVDVKTQLDNLRRWQQAGRTRYIGITHSRVSAFDELERLMKTEEMDFVQLNYSFTEPDAETRLLPLAADRGIAVIANRPFENGVLFSKTKQLSLPDWASEFNCKSWAQFSLKYILSHPAVTCVIPATSNPKHVLDNMGAGIGPLPDVALQKKMRALGAQIKAM